MYLQRYRESTLGLATARKKSPSQIFTHQISGPKWFKIQQVINTRAR